MANSNPYVAIDLSTEHGQVLRGKLVGDRLQLNEVYSFQNQPVRTPHGLFWNVLKLWDEIKTGLRIVSGSGRLPASLGINGWGMDFALLDRRGGLIGQPYHFRDSLTDGMLAESLKILSPSDIFAQTGCHFNPSNTLYQLLAMVRGDSPLFKIANSFLLLPDLFNYWLTGQIHSEITHASTTQCFDPRRGVWATPLMERLGIPTDMFPPILPAGSVIGPLQDSVSDELGGMRLLVTTPAAYDIASAAAAVPAEGSAYAWAYAGAQSMIGLPVGEPLISDQCVTDNLTNIGSLGGGFDLARTSAGSRLVDQCRLIWQQHGDQYDAGQIDQMATDSQALQAMIDLDLPEFQPAGDLPARVRSYCQRTGQSVPETRGAVIRCILESMALQYRRSLELLERANDSAVERLYLVGPGADQPLLCQLIANAIARPVLAGPVHAAAAGNILAQALALREIQSIDHSRQIARQSFKPHLYEPDPSSASRQAWDDAYAKLLNLGMITQPSSPPETLLD